MALPFLGGTTAPTANSKATAANKSKSSPTFASHCHFTSLLPMLGRPSPLLTHHTTPTHLRSFSLPRRTTIKIQSFYKPTHLLGQRKYQLILHLTWFQSRDFLQIVVEKLTGGDHVLNHLSIPATLCDIERPVGYPDHVYCPVNLTGFKK